MRNFTELIAAMRGAGDERWETMSLLGRWIAVVDDDAAVCNSMRFLLETYHFEVSNSVLVDDELMMPDAS